VISRVELIRKDKERFRSARKIPPSGKQVYTRLHFALAVVFYYLIKYSNTYRISCKKFYSKNSLINSYRIPS
jgi:hypothetical protein